MNAATPMVITIAVRIMPWAKGSATEVRLSECRPMIGGLPEGPPSVRMSRLTALPISSRPKTMRVRLRSSIR
ncbi:Uncharacterised protein [Mycobacteroides abscessus subsp. abscessus]|nr:Uncharacterised protein [Mycobacteroides abscessus subsp. abscessus]